MLRTHISHVLQRVAWSFEGLSDCWKEERSLRQWALANAVSAALTFAFEMTTAERAIIIGFGILVMAAELMNTAVEAAVDHTSVERHPLAKRAKDVASAAVMVTAFAAGAVWLVVLIG